MVKWFVHVGARSRRNRAPIAPYRLFVTSNGRYNHAVVLGFLQVSRRFAAAFFLIPGANVHPAVYDALGMSCGYLHMDDYLPAVTPTHWRQVRCRHGFTS